jgi:3-isopropylmalate/(R)-2-methylmalate dehydratase large subunit
MEGRLTLCNMSIEAGARCAMVGPDAVTFAFLEGRSYAPKGEALAAAIQQWQALATDPDAVFDREVRLDARDIAPTVTWGVSPEDALPITAHVPGGEGATGSRAAYLAEAMAYMGLSPGMALTDVIVDRVFVGSCTNARIEDLRAAAAVLKGRRVVVPGLVSPGSSVVKRMAEAEGLDRIFTDAGLVFADSGCSMCVGMNGDLAASGERVASTTNRNFRGRQGQGARTHLMSPAMVAAAAVTGRLTDVRSLPPVEG